MSDFLASLILLFIAADYIGDLVSSVQAVSQNPYLGVWVGWQLAKTGLLIDYTDTIREKNINNKNNDNND